MNRGSTPDAHGRIVAVMGIRTRGLDMKAGFRRDAADRAVRAEAKTVIQRWNNQLDRIGEPGC